ncbi:MAG: efflux RND transporter permease subunit, partial [Cyanobacteria bacterium J06633_1]
GQERFRPILMTAISSLVGFYPLVVATGAGASSRWSLGTAVFGGMLFATALTLFLVPSLYILIKGLESLVVQNKQDRGDGDGGNSPRSRSSNGRVKNTESSEKELATNYNIDLIDTPPS